MLYYILGIGMCLISIYYYRSDIIYNFIFYYDKLLIYKQKKIFCTGINEACINDFNYSITNEYLNYDIIIINFNIENSHKRMLYNSNYDFSLINEIPYYSCPIILGTINLYKNNELVKENIDITNELKSFIVYNCEVSLNNDSNTKLLWISLINKKYNTHYPKNLDIEYTIMEANINTISHNNIKIIVNNGIFTLLKI